MNLLNWDNVQNSQNSLCYTNTQRKVKREGKSRLKIFLSPWIQLILRPTLLLPFLINAPLWLNLD